MTAALAETAPREFAAGMRSAVPVLLAAAPFGLLFGALAADAGFSVAEATAMSALLFAGASQMVGLELYGGTVPPWLIVLSILAVNFRHVLYSAAFGRRIGHWPAPRQAAAFFFLTDPQFAESERRAFNEGRVGFAWYMGMALPIWVLWVIEAWLGASFGQLIADPHALGLDFLLPIYFLGLVLGFRKRPFWLPVAAASAVASIAAYHWVGSPWHVSLGAAAGIAVAVLFAPAANSRGGQA